MPGENNQSEVARLMKKIQQEYEADQHGMTGLSYGTSQHLFITARMENIGQHMEELQAIGGDEAVSLLLKTLGEQSALTNAP